MLPTEQLLGVDRSSPLYNEELRGSLFYAQAWAFTHYLLCGTDKGNLENLAAYIERFCARRVCMRSARFGKSLATTCGSSISPCASIWTAVATACAVAGPSL